MAVGEVLGVLILAGAIIAGLRSVVREQRRTGSLNLK